MQHMVITNKAVIPALLILLSEPKTLKLKKKATVVIIAASDVILMIPTRKRKKQQPQRLQKINKYKMNLKTNKHNRTTLYLLNKIQNVQVSDTTGDEQ